MDDLGWPHLIDDYAEGKDTGIIDILLAGNIDEYHINDLSRKIELRKPIPSGTDSLSDFFSLPVKCTAYFTEVKKSDAFFCCPGL